MDDFERQLLDAVSGDEMWRHLERLCEWDRTSGSEGERAAVDYLVDAIKGYGLPVKVEEFRSYLSFPESGSLELHEPDGTRPIRAKTRAFSASTPAGGVTGAIVSIQGGTNMFKGDNAIDQITPETVGGKIVLSESGSRGSMLAAQAAGAVGYVHLWPSDEPVIHEGIVTPVWGTPTPETAGSIPRIPIVSIQHDDGQAIRRMLPEGPVRATLHTRTRTGWSTLRMPVTEIPGTDPEFVLVAGHLDSWHLGATDNATGNVACLELARVFHERRDQLKRGVRVAWWSGHSTGRYSGSAWYADNHWRELDERCVAYINIDSPGSLGATDYSLVTAVPETANLVVEAVRTVTGQTPEIERPVRAGDQSFWGAGIPSLFMLLSNRPEGQRAAVGGCGMGWWWHTEDDLLDKADRDVLVADTRIYALALARLTRDERLPLDVRAQVDDLRRTLVELEDAAGEHLGLTPIADSLDDLASMLPAVLDLPADAANRAAREITHLLTAALFTRANRFEHDPAVPTAAVPSLDDARRLPKLDPSSDAYGFLRTRLVRSSNAVLHLVDQARKAADQALSAGARRPE